MTPEGIGPEETLGEGRFLRLVQRRFPGGLWEYVRRPTVACAAVVFALTDDLRVALVRQFRVPVGTEVWELPAGLVDRDETALETAQRELEEECGLHAASMEHLAVTPAAQACTSLMLEFFLARGATPVTRPQGDEPFSLECALVPMDGLARFLDERSRAQELVDIRIYAALHLARERLGLHS